MQTCRNMILLPEQQCFNSKGDSPDLTNSQRGVQILPILVKSGGGGGPRFHLFPGGGGGDRFF